MKKTSEAILPEFVIRMLAYGILAGIVIVVLYSAQALFAQPVPKPSPQTAIVATAPSTAPATTPASPAPSATQATASPPPAQPVQPASATRADAVPSGKAPASASSALLGAAQMPPLGKALAVLGTGLLLSGSALLGGALLGFLFGIPRSSQQAAAESGTPNNAPNAEQGSHQRILYSANTSLEQISDWLTKILVGVGLTQLSSLPSTLTQFADFAIPGLGGYETSGVFAVAILIYYTTCGFLMSYLWTRLYLGKALGDAEAIAAMRGEIETAVVSELQKKAQGQLAIDYEALRLTEKQLESGDVPQEELDKAFLGTGDLYRTHIYQLAKTARASNWRDPDKKKKMERTIPIFRALIATDSKPEKERYFQNYAQLGFALAESVPPDFTNAIEALDKAADLRGSANTQGYLWIEFVRAKCLADPKAHDSDTKERILKDLRIALELWPDLKEVVEADKRLSDWMKANHVSMRSLIS